MNIWIAIGIITLVVLAAIIIVFIALFKDFKKILDNPDIDMERMLSKALEEHEISHNNSSLDILPFPKPKNGLKTLKFDYDLIDNIEFDQVDTSDYPDFSDALIIGADYDGEEMTYYQIDRLNEDESFVHEKLMEHLY